MIQNVTIHTSTVIVNWLMLKQLEQISGTQAHDEQKNVGK